MLILAIESSCDETSASIVESGARVLSNIIASSSEAFERSGGVIPEEAARKQVEAINAVVEQSLEEAQCSWSDIDAIAVTKGPGLLVSLLVGTTVARTLASLHSKPLIGVHHTLGHLSSTWLEQTPLPTYPVLTLSASGGHTDLWYRTGHTTGTLVGRTRDDAAGEAFDKGASLLGLPYPGGPSISKEAEKGNQNAYNFPLPLKNDPSYDFSFSGLKTALRNLVQNEPIANSQLPIADVSASYQHAICLHLSDRVRKALKKYPETKAIHLVGGVSANTHLRQLLQQSHDCPIVWPTHIRYCTDNAAMIGAAAFFMMEEIGEGAFEAFETGASLPLEATIAHSIEATNS